MHHPEGVGLVDLVPVMMRLDMKFVERAFADPGDEAFPDARTSPRAQPVHLGMPMVEAADDRNFACIRGPHAETGARFRCPRAMTWAPIFSWMR